MKRILSLSTVLVLLSVQNIFGLPLVFKTTKEVKTVEGQGLIELASFDTLKYKNIRVGVLLIKGEFGKNDSFVRIDAIEDNTDVINIGHFFLSNTYSGNSLLVENAPSKIKISVQETGTYKVFIWASQ